MSASQPQPGRGTLRLSKPPPPQAVAKVKAAKGAPKKPAAPRKLKDPPPTPRTAQRQRAAWIAQDLSLCRERFPVVFDPERPLPLAIGAHVALGDVIGVKRAKRFLAQWTRATAYVAAVAAGGPRYQADGTPAGEVGEDHRFRAELALMERQVQLEKLGGCHAGSKESSMA